MNELNRNNGYGRILLGAVLAAGALAGLARAQDYSQQNYNQPGYDDAQAVDPPSRVARVSVAVGNVSIEPASVQQFSVAETNYPMTTGDRIYADVGANAEIQTGQLAVRMGQQTDLTVTAMTDTLAQFGLAEGSVHLRSYNIYQGEAVELDTQNVAVTVLQAGDVRVDVDPNSDVTVVRVLSGQVQVNGNGVEQVLEPGERMSFQGSNPVYAQPLGGVRPDGLDQFSAQRDGLYLSAFAADGGYVNPGTIGGEDLNGYGAWEDDGDYGAVWYPANVAYDWQPYRNGHWTWVAPWGWTWIESEPWGFAPFHYGRWNRFGDRWGWIPGPPVVRPVYSPALVAFVGGGGFSAGVTAWFPLGPREVYQPWYQTSPRYVNRVNVTNIYNRNVTEVRNIYNQRTVVNVYNVDNRSYNYANRQTATVAVSHDNFASGRSVNQSIVRVNPQQLATAQVVAHPTVSPQREMIVQTPARAVPPVMQRPVLASHEDTAVRPSAGIPRMQGGAVQPQGQPQQGAPQRQPQQPLQQQAPVQQQQSLPGRFQQPNVAGPPQRAMPQPQPSQSQVPVQQQMQQRVQPQQQPTAPAVQQPAQSSAAQQQQQRLQQQQEQQRLQQQQSQQQAQQRQQQVQQQQAQQRQQQQAQQQQQQRQLFNKAVPPEPRPSFDQQRQVMEQSEPGRPLNQQQLNNLRQNPQPAATPPQPKPQARPDSQTPKGGPVKPNEPPKS